MQRGGGSKDTWVLADGPVSAFSLLPGRRGRTHAARRDCRAAPPSNLFWLGRYAERGEGTVRAAARRAARLADERRVARTAFPRCDRAACRDRGCSTTAIAGPADAERRRRRSSAALIAALVDRDARRSLAFNVAQTTASPSGTRRLSSDNWRLAHELARRRAAAAPGVEPDDALELIDPRSCRSSPSAASDRRT